MRTHAVTQQHPAALPGAHCHPWRAPTRCLLGCAQKHDAGKGAPLKGERSSLGSSNLGSSNLGSGKLSHATPVPSVGGGERAMGGGSAQGRGHKPQGRQSLQVHTQVRARQAQGWVNHASHHGMLWRTPQACRACTKECIQALHTREGHECG